MAWVAAAVVGGNLVNGYFQSKSADKANRSLTDANNRAMDIQQQQFNQQRADNMPMLDARNASLQRLQALLGIAGPTTAKGYGSLAGPINPGDVTKEAGYQFGLNQGQTALNNQLAARGMRNSGAALMQAARYGNDYATTKYNDAFNRELTNRNAQLQPLQSLAGLGQSGVNGINQASQNYANNASGLLTNQGENNALAAIAKGNAWGNAVNQIGGWYQNYSKPPANPFQGNGMLTEYGN